MVDDVDWGELLIRPPERSLAILPAESSSNKSGGYERRKLYILCTKYLFYMPPKEGVLRIFIALKKSLSSAGFEPTKLESNGKHANHHRGDSQYS
jgi:hypothetical protein